MLARLLIARHRLDDAMALLARLVEAADAGERRTSVLAILVVQALAHAGMGEPASALTVLARALVLAEPEGYVRIFADEGASMLRLLEQIRGARPVQFPGAADVAHAYVRTLMDALGQNIDAVPAPVAASPAATKDEPLTESLNTRELEVLDLLAAGHSNQEIARMLIVGLATVKTHINNIYAKLAGSSAGSVNRAAMALDPKVYGGS